jgi:hypothetical protein
MTLDGTFSYRYQHLHGITLSHLNQRKLLRGYQIIFRYDYEIRNCIHRESKLLVHSNKTMCVIALV